MDVPIMCPRYKNPNNGEEFLVSTLDEDGKEVVLRLIKGKGLRPSNIDEERLLSALQNDDKDVFLRLIKDKGLRPFNVDDFPSDLFMYDAVEIAIAILNGETKGILDMEDLSSGAQTPLHLAASYRAPRLTKYLLHRGDKVDVTCDGETPFDVVFKLIYYGPPRRSLSKMLTWLCYHHRGSMEVIRMLVLYMQDTTHVKQRLVKYAHEDEVNKFAALFLAVPELFLSSPGSGLSLFSELKREFDSSVNNTNVLPLLLDIFAIAGHEIAAYIRLEEFCVPKPSSAESYDKSHLEVNFFLCEVVRRKLGVFSPDYYLRFFEADPLNYYYSDGDDDDGPVPDWNDFASKYDGMSITAFLPYLLDRKDFNRTAIYRLIPRLDPQDAARLNSAIEKKLSSMSSLHGFLKTSAKISEWGKHLLYPIVVPKYYELTKSLRASMPSGKQMSVVKFCTTKSLDNNKPIVQTPKLKPFFSFLKPVQFARVAKYLPK